MCLAFPFIDISTKLIDNELCHSTERLQKKKKQTTTRDPHSKREGARHVIAVAVGVVCLFVRIAFMCVSVIQSRLTTIRILKTSFSWHLAFCPFGAFTCRSLAQVRVRIRNLVKRITDMLLRLATAGISKQ